MSKFVKITVIGIFGTKKGSGVTLHVGDGRTSGMGARQESQERAHVGAPLRFLV
ncbi:hypothetical protein [Coleofasciculus sp. E1-EBD-02]|uniref:hypothetical protein n=1 Tax=Coleofasciculus sp. E1-EBD-02 TaxID=3068481 RepID=UPI0032FCBCDB